MLHYKRIYGNNILIEKLDNSVPCTVDNYCSRIVINRSVNISKENNHKFY